ncbi:MAG: type II toxin-antitoxin system HicA family toxin [Chloroflexi bacterium]|nr:type II toxin-antitoxin system HicA family toxin [Chloroflexota bacterium]
MKKRRLDKYKSDKQFLAHARRSENYAGEQVEGSHHTVFSKRGGFVVIPVHGNKDLPTGTKRSIVKRMIAIGLSVLIMIGALLVWLGGML